MTARDSWVGGRKFPEIGGPCDLDRSIKGGCQSYLLVLSCEMLTELGSQSRNAELTGINAYNKHRKEFKP